MAYSPGQARLEPGSNFFGLATIVPGSNVTLNASNAFIGLTTTVLGSAPTLFAVVNTSAAGQASIVLDTGTKFIGLTTTVLSRSPILGAGDTNALFASTATGSMLNVALMGRTGNVATVDSSGNQAVLINNSMVTVTLGTVLSSANDTVGVVHNSNVSLNPSNSFIGLTTTVIGSAPTIFAVVNTGASNSNVTLNPSPNFIGLVTVVNGNQPALIASSAYIGLASVNIGGTLPALTAGSAYVGLASVNIGGTLPALTAGSAYVGLASVNIGGTLPALAAGSAFIGLVSAASINGNVDLKTGRTLNIAQIALSATNLSGATAFISSASKKYYITNLILSTASNVGINFINQGTYLTGNASLMIQLAPQGGIVENNNPSAPLYFALANQTNFLITTNTAAPISGRVTWYEE